MLSMGIARSAIQIVLNRVEMKLFKSIDAGDAARVLKHPVLATICNDYKLLNNAQDEGELVGEIQRKCRFVKEIASLSESLAARLEETRRDVEDQALRSGTDRKSKSVNSSNE